MDEQNKSFTSDSIKDANDKNNQTESPNEPESSAVSDLLHVLGIKKKLSQPLKTTIDKELVPSSTEKATLKSNSEFFEEPTSVAQNGNEILEGALIPIGTEEYALHTDAPVSKQSPRPIRVVAFLLVAALGFAALRFLPILLEPTPPSKNVVGSYNGKNITVEQLQSFIDIEGAKEREHMLCPVHGYDHSKCDPSEECESHPIDSLEGYREMVGRLAVEQIVTEWAQTQGITNREEVQHGMKDLLNDVTVEQYISQLHEENITTDSISKWEVQQYYSENLNRFQGKTLDDVEGEIRQILVSQRDEDFFPAFIEELKKTAGLQLNLDVLKVAVPAEEEIQAYYNANLNQYEMSASVNFKELRISADKADTAPAAIRKIRSGESFESVAATFAQGGKLQSQSLTKGKGEASIESVIWKMNVDDISDPITNSDGTVSIIQLTEMTKAGTKSLESVKKEIENLLILANTEKEYNSRKNDTLFSIHSRRYTLGEFYTEFKELSDENQAKLGSYDAKKQLVEQMISRELLLEKSGDSTSNSATDHQLEELQIQYLSQILHEEEVDANLIEPTEEEILSFYEKNQKDLINPATVEMNLIWIDQGANAEKKEQALTKANEAMALIQSGTSFSEAAKKYSEDASASAGGQIEGALHEEYLASQIAKPAFSLKVGEVSPIIDFNNGYYIIQVRNRTEASTPTFDEVSDTIKSHLQELSHEQLTANMQEKMLKDAELTIYNKTLRNLLSAS
ncbi:MAG: peptidyl-prolyl cis-trans isomerase [Oscillospiraceae bacterium]|nr:peptidyl-prolyl cis-trans isomerase [Oscillospiraceae bacterium]